MSTPHGSWDLGFQVRVKCVFVDGQLSPPPLFCLLPFCLLPLCPAAHQPGMVYSLSRLGQGRACTTPSLAYSFLLQECQSAWRRTAQRSGNQGCPGRGAGEEIPETTLFPLFFPWRVQVCVRSKQRVRDAIGSLIHCHDRRTENDVRAYMAGRGRAGNRNETLFDVRLLFNSTGLVSGSLGRGHGHLTGRTAGAVGRLGGFDRLAGWQVDGWFWRGVGVRISFRI